MKKYVLFIVEGINDQIEIQAMLRAYCGERFSDRFVDEYLPGNGDITANMKIPDKKVVEELNRRVLNWRQGHNKLRLKISPSEVHKVIHIVDTDGAYVPNTCIVEGDYGEVRYEGDEILCGNRETIMGRNHHKRRVLTKLQQTRRVDNIPYELYFASCNMDHVLFDQQSPLPTAKSGNARQFAMECKTPGDLSHSVFDEAVKAGEDLPESWTFIQKEKNSLHRHANLHLMLEGFNAPD